MSTFLMIIKLLPSIISAVKAAEEFIPLPKNGAAKLEFVLGLLTDTMDDIGGILPVITKVIARIVSAANATGLFGK